VGIRAPREPQQEVTAAIEAEERELEQMRMKGEQEELAAEQSFPAQFCRALDVQTC
jgi:hypothetical protein